MCRAGPMTGTTTYHPCSRSPPLVLPPHTVSPHTAHTHGSHSIPSPRSSSPWSGALLAGFLGRRRHGSTTPWLPRTSPLPVLSLLRRAPPPWLLSAIPAPPHLYHGWQPSSTSVRCHARPPPRRPSSGRRPWTRPRARRCFSFVGVPPRPPSLTRPGASPPSSCTHVCTALWCSSAGLVPCLLDHSSSGCISARPPPPDPLVGAAPSPWDQVKWTLLVPVGTSIAA